METLRIEGGEVQNLLWHNRRFNRSRRELFGAEEELDLADFLGDLPGEGIWRARVLYTLYIEKVELLPYTLRLPKSFASVEFQDDYRFKYADRSSFDALKAAHPEAEELLLCRDGLLTDTTIANLALYRDGRWFTPARPLLEGTTRARLLVEGKLIPAEIPCASLGEYEALAVMNAMMGFRVLEDWEIV
ncbi:aminotransferase class IV [Nitratifractor salsuginis]|uniref:aminotransferase class IV n=1 Tax=Nitratifractor salsuginis TaxID=269261 RepID=UPI00145D3BBF|nr:aminotransferase class IV [Nitratifractor salsuginis]